MLFWYRGPLVPALSPLLPSSGSDTPGTPIISPGVGGWGYSIWSLQKKPWERSLSEKGE